MAPYIGLGALGFLIAGPTGAVIGLLIWAIIEILAEMSS